MRVLRNAALRRVLVPCVFLVVSGGSARADESTAVQRSFTVQITVQEAATIGQRIWRNEGAGKIENLTVWNKDEAFPSFGIGHFIWFPRDVEEPFVESFPQLIAHLRQSQPVPAWLHETHDAPWTNRAAFYADIDSARMTQLRTFLAETVAEQTRFIIARLEAALPRLLDAAGDDSRRDHIRRQFYRVAGTRNGVYALIDYVNFKGEGVSLKERYKGQGWGLLQVLENMNPAAADPAAEFVRAADQVLTRRVANAERDETQWLPGWRKRLETYR